MLPSKETRWILQFDEAVTLYIKVQFSPFKTINYNFWLNKPLLQLINLLLVCKLVVKLGIR